MTFYYAHTHQKDDVLDGCCCALLVRHRLRPIAVLCPDAHSLGTNVHKERVDDNKTTGPLLANFSLYIYTTTKVLERGGGKQTQIS